MFLLTLFVARDAPTIVNTDDQKPDDSNSEARSQGSEYQWLPDGTDLVGKPFNTRIDGRDLGFDIHHPAADPVGEIHDRTHGDRVADPDDDHRDRHIAPNPDAD